MCAVGIVRFGTFAPAFGATLLRIVSCGAFAAAAAGELGGFCTDRSGGMAALVPQFRHAARTAAYRGLVARSAPLSPGLIRRPVRLHNRPGIVVFVVRNQERTIESTV